jgi:hypothetical protein
MRFADFTGNSAQRIKEHQIGFRSHLRKVEVRSGYSAQSPLVVVTHHVRPRTRTEDQSLQITCDWRRRC